MSNDLFDEYHVNKILCTTVRMSVADVARLREVEYSYKEFNFLPDFCRILLATSTRKFLRAVNQILRQAMCGRLVCRRDRDVFLIAPK